ncbi:MAG: hypothetical protein LBQ59_00025 [Candidatus Peribacteria bacterium]|nr:hypothetical protein [Candidatus Peribacteria bacterium]
MPENSEKIENTENNVYDINISSINDVFSLLVNNKYDFVTFEPSDNEVKLEFRKEKAIVDTKFIKYPIYSNILLKAK